MLRMANTSLSLPLSPRSAPMHSDKPPPVSDLSHKIRSPEANPSSEIITTSIEIPLELDITSPAAKATISPSYFSQNDSTGQPIYPSTISPNTSSLLVPSATGSEILGSSNNMPLPTAPNPHFHLALASAVNSTREPHTPLVPTTISHSTTLNLPGFQLSTSSCTPDPQPSLPAATSSNQKKVPPTNISISKDDSFVSESNGSGVRASRKNSSDSILPSSAGPTSDRQTSHSATEPKSFMELQAKAVAKTVASILAYKRTSVSHNIFPQGGDALPAVKENSATRRASTFNLNDPQITLQNTPVQKLLQHKFRSPSLPVNSLASTIEIPPNLNTIPLDELAEIISRPESKKTILIVDVRPFTQYSKTRICSAINVCIPSTLLKRPAFVLSRFGECMIPSQREAIDNLAQYEDVVIYDQFTSEISVTTDSALLYTILKFNRSDKLKGRLSFLKGGFSSFATSFPSLIDESEIQIIDNSPNKAPTTAANATFSRNSSSSVITNNDTKLNDLHLNSSSTLPSHSHSNSQPDNLTLPPAQTFNFPPVLTGFSLPANSIKDGPLKPFASNINKFTEHTDLAEKATPVNLPDDLDPSEVQSYLPLWLQDIINHNTGPLHIARRFHDIEQAEKVRLQSAFNRGSRMISNRSPSISTPRSVNSEDGVNYSFSAGVELGAKNRYSNIWPYDHTRVRLPEIDEKLQIQESPKNPSLSSFTIAAADPLEEKCDYFNGSYITTSEPSLRYIATQGPLPDTFVDFWHVVWDKKIPIIVMLTAEIEGGTTKCHKYWANEIYGTLSLTKTSSERILLSSKTKTLVTIRKFVLAPTAVALATGAVTADTGNVLSGRGTYYNPHLSSDSHTVIQIQYTSWPDLGSPASPEDLIALCRIKNSYLEEWKQYLQSKTKQTLSEEELSPWTIVHCSAGCGRTGTFCTVDLVISLLAQQMKKAKSPTLESSPFHSSCPEQTPSAQQTARPGDSEAFESRDLIYRTVHDFRRQRLSMVQVLRQYALCYETVIFWIHEQYKNQKK